MIIGITKYQRTIYKGNLFNNILHLLTHLSGVILKNVSSMCDIPWYRAFPRNPFIINISMYFGATEKWHVQMVMVSRVVQLAGASDAPSGTRVPNRPVYAVILVMPDV